MACETACVSSSHASFQEFNSPETVPSILENAPIVFACSPDPFGHSLEQHGIQPISSIISKEVRRALERQLSL
jgi:hypothetical protein